MALKRKEKRRLQSAYRSSSFGAAVASAVIHSPDGLSDNDLWILHDTGMSGAVDSLGRDLSAEEDDYLRSEFLPEMIANMSR